jgi:glyoxylase-like metal-dependent hydrolase (beta-lactamase superfamily II)
MGLLRILKNLLPPWGRFQKALPKPGDSLARVFKGVTFIYDKENEIPYFLPLDGIRQLLPLSYYMIPPIFWTNCFIIGDPGENRYIIDPSPKDNEEYRKLVNTLKKFQDTYSGIFITHHHIDHHHLAPQLARDFSLPVTMSETTHRWLLKRHGKNYLDAVEIKFAKEGDVLTQWQGKEVKVYEVPGHDNGQLGLAPDTMEWFLVGDLIEDKSTVVIGTEEGDMARYFASLERIIRMDPKLLLPSHGMVMETTARLKETLEHRKIREQQVRHLRQKGKTPEQMVKIIYNNVDKRLWPLALENVKSHLQKLEKEKAI